MLVSAPVNSGSHGSVWEVFLPVATPKWSCYFLYIFNKVIYICHKDATIFKDFSGDHRLFCKKKNNCFGEQFINVYTAFKVVESLS